MPTEKYFVPPNIYFIINSEHDGCHAEKKK